jgi:hypothetical protein
VLIPYRKIEEAYEFVSAGPLHAHGALLDLATGEVLLRSESGGLDEFPAVIDPDRFLALPTRGELHLGKTLVLSFVATHVPWASAEVLDMFSRKGAYPRFKRFLDENGLVDRWYAYEGQQTEQALRGWCASRGLSVAG